MEKILSIANEFYIMTNTAINKEKSVLKTNAKNLPKPLVLKFENNQIDIENTMDSVCFFKVWVKLATSKKYTINQIRQEVKKFINIIKRKPLIDKQMIYITNMVLIPIITYRL